MDRRIFISTLASLPFISSARAAVPWKAEFFLAASAGETQMAGFHIVLEKGWKTYWRNPGQAGIPPDIKIIGENVGSFTIGFPLPQRIVDDSGEALGYHDEVMFPISIVLKDTRKSFKPHIESFFGVCSIVCTPAKFESDASFQINTPATASLIDWLKRVPQPMQFITAAHVSEKYLVLDLNQSLQDIFVEGPDRYYFRAPDFSKESGKAWIKVEGLKDAKDLLSLKLRITADANGQGLEQFITVA
jgi:DsbC/DsbD-like thiol-disulfide interchange protein